MIFYKATGGATDWKNDGNWGSTRPLVTWQSVTTTAAGRVTHLALDDNRLTGTIPAELGKLTNLVRLSLTSNQLSGTIPAELAKLTNLNWLSLSDNQFSGCIPASLREMLINDLNRL